MIETIFKILGRILIIALGLWWALYLFIIFPIIIGNGGSWQVYYTILYVSTVVFMGSLVFIGTVVW